MTRSHKACSFHGLFGTRAPRMGWTTAAGALLALGQSLSRAKRKQTQVLVQEGCLCRWPMSLCNECGARKAGRLWPHARGSCGSSGVSNPMAGCLYQVIARLIPTRRVSSLQPEMSRGTLCHKSATPQLCLHPPQCGSCVTYSRAWGSRPHSPPPTPTLSSLPNPAKPLGSLRAKLEV